MVANSLNSEYYTINERPTFVITPGIYYQTSSLEKTRFVVSTSCYLCCKDIVLLLQQVVFVMHSDIFVVNV